MRSSSRYNGVSSKQCCNLAFSGNGGYYSTESLTVQLSNIVVAAVLIGGFALGALSFGRSDSSSLNDRYGTAFATCAGLSVCFSLLSTMLSIFIILALRQHRVHVDDQALVERVVRTYIVPSLVVVALFGLSLVLFMVEMALLVALTQTTTAAIIVAVGSGVSCCSICGGLWWIYCYLRPVDDTAFAESQIDWQKRWKAKFEDEFLTKEAETTPEPAPAAAGVEMALHEGHESDEDK